MDIYEAINTMKLGRKTIYDLPLRVTSYGRVSSKTDAQLNSISNQIDAYEEMIKKNENWIFVEGYVDEVRGESATNRENFMRMIEDSKLDMFDLIITKEISRFARNTVDSLLYTRDLLRQGVGVYFMSDNLCTIDSDAELRLTIMSGIAQDEVRKLSERIKFGHKRAISDGVVLGNARIFGYDKKDGKLIIDDAEADMVRLIFDLYATDNNSSRAIVEILYNKGYRNHNGNKIAHPTINAIIQNPKYKGYYCGNKVKIIDYRTKEQKFLPPEEWKMYKDETGKIVPQIVDEDTWDRANEIFQRRSKIVKDQKTGINTKSSFNGKLWCEGHDAPYWRNYNRISKDKEIVYFWTCSIKRSEGAKACNSINIYERDLYKILKTFFSSVITNIDSLIDDYIEIHKSVDADQNFIKKINSTKSELDKISNRKDKLLDLYVDDKIKADEFEKRNKIFNNSLEELEAEIKELEKLKLNDDQYVKYLQNTKKYFKKKFESEEQINNLSDKDIDEIIKVAVDRIYATPIDASSMKLSIRLKTGNEGVMQYKKSVRNSGQMFKKMIPEFRTSVERTNRTACGQKDIINYSMSMVI